MSNTFKKKYTAFQRHILARIFTKQELSDLDRIYNDVKMDVLRDRKIKSLGRKYIKMYEEYYKDMNALKMIKAMCPDKGIKWVGKPLNIPLKTIVTNKENKRSWIKKERGIMHPEK